MVVTVQEQGMREVRVPHTQMQPSGGTCAILVKNESKPLFAAPGKGKAVGPEPHGALHGAAKVSRQSPAVLYLLAETSRRPPEVIIDINKSTTPRSPKSAGPLAGPRGCGGWFEGLELAKLE